MCAQDLNGYGNEMITTSKYLLTHEDVADCFLAVSILMNMGLEELLSESNLSARSSTLFGRPFCFVKGNCYFVLYEMKCNIWLLPQAFTVIYGTKVHYEVKLSKKIGQHVW